MKHPSISYLPAVASFFAAAVAQNTLIGYEPVSSNTYTQWACASDDYRITSNNFVGCIESTRDPQLPFTTCTSDSLRYGASSVYTCNSPNHCQIGHITDGQSQVFTQWSCDTSTSKDWVLALPTGAVFIDTSGNTFGAMPSGSTSSLIATGAPSITNNNPASLPINTSNSSSNSSGISGGAIAGIVVGVIGGLALIAGIIFFIWRSRRKSHKAAHVASGATTMAPMNGPQSEMAQDHQQHPAPPYDAHAGGYYKATGVEQSQGYGAQYDQGMYGPNAAGVYAKNDGGVYAQNGYPSPSHQVPSNALMEMDAVGSLAQGQVPAAAEMPAAETRPQGAFSELPAGESR